MLDTNICIGIINRRGENAIKQLAKCEPGDVSVSSITVAELRYGADKSKSAAKNHQALDFFLMPLVVAEFNDRAALAYGNVRAELERLGTPIGPLDTLIAAHALSLEVTLVTNNVREFARVKELVLQNWLSGGRC